MSRWLVISPEYEFVDVIVDGQGPTEIVRDVVEVEAATKRDALLLGVKAMRANPRENAWLRRYADNPFAGMVVKRADA